MNQYRRIVSYLYKYANDKKGENTGFVRIDTRQDGIRLHVHIKDLRMMDERQLKVYFYFHKEERIQLVFVDEFLCMRGNCEYKKLVFPDFTDAEFDKMNGIVFLDQRGLLYGSCWDEREISEGMFLEKNEKEENKLQIEEVKGPNKPQIEEVRESDELRIEEVNESDKVPDAMKETEVESVETSIEESLHTSELTEIAVPVDERDKGKQDSLLSQCEVIDLDGAEDFVSAVKIQLQDISKLPSKEWKLADNAFLKQGYEADNHLLLGKIEMQNGRDVWILGVPGNYDNREKYLAGIFGFSDYIPKEKREFRTGGSGYWIRQISSVE